MTGSRCWLRRPPGGGAAPVAGRDRGVELPAAQRDMSGGCSASSRCSPARSRWTPPQAVAGAAAGPAVLHLVDCSLLAPPRIGPDGRSRYLMLETLRAYGLERLPRPASSPRPPPPWPGTPCRWRSRPRPACRPAPGSWPPPGGWTPRTPPPSRPWPGRWSTTRPPRCAWRSPWRPGGCCAAARRPGTRCCTPPPGTPHRASDAWCAAQLWLGHLAALHVAIWSAALGHFTAVRDALAAGAPSPALV